jgi:hypothetical protein
MKEGILKMGSLGGSVAHEPLWLPASSSVCSLLAFSSESSEPSLYGAPALYCSTCNIKKKKKNLILVCTYFLKNGEVTSE